MSYREFFKGKVVVLTGGSSGIGRASSFLLAQMGARVISIGRTEEHIKEVAKLHKNIKGVQIDLLRDDASKKLITFIKSNYKKVDGFVHCAGVIYTESFETFRMYELEEMEKINVNAGFELLQGLLPFFRKGSVVFVSSIDAFFKEAIPSSGYALTKAAILGLVGALAGELGERGIRVNAIVPGLIRTPMTEDFFTEEFNKQREDFLERVPLKRAGTAEEVAKLILFLLSDDSSYITGDAIFIDGGYHIG